MSLELQMYVCYPLQKGASNGSGPAKGLTEREIARKYNHVNELYIISHFINVSFNTNNYFYMEDLLYLRLARYISLLLVLSFELSKFAINHAYTKLPYRE